MALRVLLVDDEEDILWGLSRLLTKAGYEVITAPDGPEALEILQTQPFDILITDIKMPKMSGLDLIMKARERYPQMKAIVMTARGSEELARETMERGAVEYIEKPFDLDYFLGVVKRAQAAGFRGVVRGLRLVDVLQMLALEGATAAVRVSAPGGSGTIYFEDGKVAHAAFDNTEGTEAFKRILALEGGSFSLDRTATPPKRTIDASLDSLMLSVYSEMDEESAGTGVVAEEEIDLESFSISSVLGEEVEAPSYPQELVERIKGHLEPLVSEAGARVAFLVNQTGHPVAVVGEAGGFGDLVGGVNAVSRFLEAAGAGPLGDITAQSPEGFLVAKRLSAGILGAVAPNSQNPAIVRVNLLKAAVLVERELKETNAQ